MGIEYTNRKGKKYYLNVGKTKTGKPRHYFSMKIRDQLAEEIPEGFEIYEHPANAQVFFSQKDSGYHIGNGEETRSKGTQKIRWS